MCLECFMLCEVSLQIKCIIIMNIINAAIMFFFFKQPGLSVRIFGITASVDSQDLFVLQHRCNKYQDVQSVIGQTSSPRDRHI